MLKVNQELVVISEAGRQRILHSNIAIPSCYRNFPLLLFGLRHQHEHVLAGAFHQVFFPRKFFQQGR